MFIYLHFSNKRPTVLWRKKPDIETVVVIVRRRTRHSAPGGGRRVGELK